MNYYYKNYFEKSVFEYKIDYSKVKEFVENIDYDLEYYKMDETSKKHVYNEENILIFLKKIKNTKEDYLKHFGKKYSYMNEILFKMYKKIYKPNELIKGFGLINVKFDSSKGNEKKQRENNIKINLENFYYLVENYPEDLEKITNFLLYIYGYKENYIYEYVSKDIQIMIDKLYSQQYLETIKRNHIINYENLNSIDFEMFSDEKLFDILTVITKLTKSQIIEKHKKDLIRIIKEKKALSLFKNIIKNKKFNLNEIEDIYINLDFDQKEMVFKEMFLNGFINKNIILNSEKETTSILLSVINQSLYKDGGLSFEEIMSTLKKLKLIIDSKNGIKINNEFVDCFGKYSLYFYKLLKKFINSKDDTNIHFDKESEKNFLDKIIKEKLLKSSVSTPFDLYMSEIILIEKELNHSDFVSGFVNLNKTRIKVIVGGEDSCKIFLKYINFEEIDINTIQLLITKLNLITDYKCEEIKSFLLKLFNDEKVLKIDFEYLEDRYKEIIYKSIYQNNIESKIKYYNFNFLPKSSEIYKKITSLNLKELEEITKDKKINNSKKTSNQ